MNLFVYQYSYDEDKQGSSSQIRAYGINEQQETCLVKIKGFRPWCYMEVIQSDAANAIDLSKRHYLDLLATQINNKITSSADWRISKGFFNQYDDIRDLWVEKTEFCWRKKLYYAHVQWNADTQKYDDVLYPYVKVWFKTNMAMRLFESVLRKQPNICIDNIRKKYVEIRVHEGESIFHPIFKFWAQLNISACGWIKIKRMKLTSAKNKDSELKHEYETNIENIENNSSLTKTVSPTVLCFDLECYSSIAGTFPDPTRPEDCVFNISVTLHKANTSSKQKFLFTLGDPEPIPDVQMFKYGHAEILLLLGFKDFINEHKPNVITGYNILGFDWKYILARCNYLLCENDFSKIGYLTNVQSEKIETKWESKARRAQNYCYLDIPGIVQIDLLPVIMKDWNFSSYKLDNVCKEFGFQGKLPLSAEQIFECYKEGMKKGNQQLLTKVGMYCVNDTEITHRLFDHLQTWFSVCEMSKTANVPIMYVFTKGNQVQMFSQFIQHCFHTDIIIQRNEYENLCDGYEGAIVLDPTPGLYNNVLSFDFASLYPSIIMAHNIDYSTFLNLNDPDYQNFPEAHCHVRIWDFVNKKTGQTEHFDFRFIKQEYSKKGVIPTIIMNHINARKQTRSLIKKYENQLETTVDTDERNRIKSICDLLEKRQLAYKVCANSMYGGMGVKTGYLPFYQGALTTTKIGRQSIEYVADFLKTKYDATVIYGDSVTGETPIIIQDFHNRIHILPIERLSDSNSWKSYYGFKLFDQCLRSEKQQSNEMHIDSYPSQSCENFRVWTHLGWSKIKRIIRHKVNKKIYKITTSDSQVRVTEDHSLLKPDGSILKTSDTKKGDNLLQLMPNFTQCSNASPGLNESSAFVFGSFIGANKFLPQNWIYFVDQLINNHSKQMTHFASLSEFELKELVPILKKANFDLQFDYIPSQILNNNLSIQLAFIKGYCHVSKFIRIHTSNQAIVQGLYYLSCKLNRPTTLNYHQNKWYFSMSNEFKALKSSSFTHKSSLLTKSRFNVFNMYGRHQPSIQNNSINTENTIRSISQNTHTENNLVFDIETEFGTFAAGIGSIIVKNTDSCHVSFADVASKLQAETKAEVITKDINATLIAPMKLEYEKLYNKYFILSKKRYMAFCLDDNNVITSKIEKGVLPKRRDNCLFARKLYQNCVDLIMNGSSKEETLNFVVNQCQSMFQRNLFLSEFIITKQVNQEYKIKPAHKLLSETMQKRGTAVVAGSRIAYLFVDYKTGVKKIKQCDVIEDVEYYKHWMSYVHLDFLIYLEKIVKPIDEILEIGLNVKDMMAKYYNIHYYKLLTNKKIKELFGSNIEIEAF